MDLPGLTEKVVLQIADLSSQVLLFLLFSLSRKSAHESVHVACGILSADERGGTRVSRGREAGMVESAMDPCER